MTEPKIIYEDENFLAINKPAGLLVHATPNSKFQIPNSQEPTLVDWLLKNYPEIKNVGDPVKLPDGNYGAGDPLRPGIVHRLDKDTSGVMLIAKKQKTFDYLKELFQKREIKKTYLALVWGAVRPPRGVIDKPISLKSGTIKHTVHKGKMEKEAVTEYAVIKKFQIPNPSEAEQVRCGAGKSQMVRHAHHPERDRRANHKSQIPNPEFCDLTLLEVKPKTGRTHQIRVHLASIGHPVVGDRLYGHRQIPNPKSQIPNDRLMLHALALEFTKEDGGRIRVEAEPPHQFLETINNTAGF